MILLEDQLFYIEKQMILQLSLLEIQEKRLHAE